MNGIEAMAEVPPALRKLRIRVATEDVRALRVQVRDAGRALDASERSRVFEAFYTTKASGMGMGLAISRSIVEARRRRLCARRTRTAVKPSASRCPRRCAGLTQGHRWLAEERHTEAFDRPDLVRPRTVLEWRGGSLASAAPNDGYEALRMQFRLTGRGRDLPITLPN